MRHPLVLLSFLCLSMLLGVAPAYAGDIDETPSQDQLHELVLKGKILSLATLKSQVLARLPGELIDVSVARGDDAIVYEFRILREDGQVTEVEVDAASGKIIEIENE